MAVVTLSAAFLARTTTSDQLLVGQKRSQGIFEITCRHDPELHSRWVRLLAFVRLNSRTTVRSSGSCSTGSDRVTARDSEVAKIVIAEPYPCAGQVLRDATADDAQNSLR